MRITGGLARGIQLKVPKNNPLRPSTDYLRQALFSSLGTLIEGKRVMDCFCGTGAYGLEALSRGALEVSFAEKDQGVFKSLEDNLKRVYHSMGLDKAQGLKVSTQCFRVDLTSNFVSLKPAEIVLAGPPYPLLEENPLQIIQTLVKLHLPSREGRIILEVPSHLELPTPHGYKLVKRFKRKGHQPGAYIWAFISA